MPKPSMEEIIKIVNEQNSIQNNDVIEEEEIEQEQQDEIEQAIKSILDNPITNFSDDEIKELLEEKSE